VTTLDWRDRRHWSPRRAACVDCGGKTNLRDDDSRPQHKLCAEHAVAGGRHADRWCRLCRETP
jgi:hypothetical protein